MAERSRERSWRSLAVGPGVALLVAGGILVLDGETGLVPLVRLMREADGARDRLAALQQERARLRREVRDLRSDPRAIEAAAREQLGMVRSGELVIRWPRDPAAGD